MGDKMTLANIIEEIVHFRDQRDWNQFHTPKNLAVALAIEVAELQEIMLWKNDEETTDLANTSDGHGKFSDEIADVMIYALLFCKATNINPEAAIRTKLEKNRERYPIEKSKGSSLKYTEL